MNGTGNSVDIRPETAPRYTPGPWRHAKRGNFGNLIEARSGRKHGELDDGWRAVATVQDCCASDLWSEQELNRRANIDLVAAAPDLLRELKAAERWLSGMHSETDEGIETELREVHSAAWEAIDQMRAAIAKAEGRA